MRKGVIILVLCSLILTACGMAEGIGVHDGSITGFIDSGALTLETGGTQAFYNDNPYMLTADQWQEIRALFDETQWAELDDADLPERGTETGFMSFFGESGETISFILPENIVTTLELAPDKPEPPQTANRHYAIDAATVEAI